jgi:5-methyltetrahydropteroyltriglutamate--homocysteine methyltransferase
MLARHLPPFRADHVGSLLRPARVKEARAKSTNCEISQDELSRCEDEAIEHVIRKQEEIGLQSVTDGELRREMWHWDFLAGLDGVELIELGEGVRFAGVRTKSRALVVTEKIGVTKAPMLDHFEFVQQRTKHTAKMTIPSPAMLFSVARDWRPNLNRNIYPSPMAAFDDLAAAYRSIIRQYYDAGCRYLQLDECNLPMLCDRTYHAQLRERGDDPDLLIKGFSRLINAALLAALPIWQLPSIRAAETSAPNGWRKAATTPSPSICLVRWTSTGFLPSTIPTVPVASSLCASCPRTSC